jgi:predicted metal-binding membrane protein
MADGDAPWRPVAELPRRDRVIVAACAAALTLLAWAYLVYLARQMTVHDATGSMPDMPDMPGMQMAMPASWSLTELAFLFWMWTVMMVGMMTPAAMPVMLLFARAQAAHGATRARISVVVFALGYAIVWAAFSACAALAQWTLHGLAMMSPSMATSSTRIGGAIVCAAGLWQLFPVKRACLVRCRSPIAFLMMHWRNGTLGALRMGLRHGTWCLGCCFALMGVLFVVGVMNLVFVAALALFVLLEKTGPAGLLVARAGGVLLLAAGAFMLVTG